jgi:hypothetical protein
MLGVYSEPKGVVYAQAYIRLGVGRIFWKGYLCTERTIGYSSQLNILTAQQSSYFEKTLIINITYILTNLKLDQLNM